MFPARNNEIEPYNNGLNIAIGMYFSANANMAMAENPTATKIKYNFFRRFIISLGIMKSLIHVDFTSQAKHRALRDFAG